MKDWLIKIRDADIRNILAIMVTLGTFLLFYFLLIKPMPIENKEMLLMAGGYVFGATQFVLGYYFGSSKEKKDQTINTNT